MKECKYCFSEMVDDSFFCENCGFLYSKEENQKNQPISSKLFKKDKISQNKDQPIKISSLQDYYIKKKRPLPLIVAFIINYFSLIFLGPITLVILSLNNLIFDGLLLGIIIILGYYAQNYNNLARFFFICLFIISLQISLMTLNYLGLFVSLYQIYILAFYTETLNIFKFPYVEKNSIEVKNNASI